MRFVAPKNPEQQAVLHLQHARRLLVKQRVAVDNHIRAVLAEYGLCLPQGVKVVSQRLPAILEDAENGLPMLTRHLLAELKAEHAALIERVQRLATDVERVVRRWTSTYTNARLEGLNGLFEAARARARGYRNTETFMTMTT